MIGSFVAPQIALLLASFPTLQEPPPSAKPEPLPEWKSPAQEPRPVEVEAAGGRAIQFEPRFGGWWTGRFEAATPLGQRTIKTDLLIDNGLDLGVDLGSWGLSLTADYGASQDLTLVTGGLLIGTSFVLADQDPLPVDLRLAAGVLAGRLEVDAKGFGDFDPGFGFEARASVAAWVRRDVALTVWLDYRQIEFEYAEAVTSGDTDFPGSSVALGGSIILRF